MSEKDLDKAISEYKAMNRHGSSFIDDLIADRERLMSVLAIACVSLEASEILSGKKDEANE